MSQALLALLPFHLIHTSAVRPQEDARFSSNWGTPGTSWLELGEGNASREDTRTLAVGHSAGLQHEAGSKRLNTQASLVNAGLALAQFALSESGREPHNVAGSTDNPTLANKGSQKAPERRQEEPDDNTANAENAEPKVIIHSGVGKEQEDPHAAKIDGNTPNKAHVVKVPQQEKQVDDAQSEARKQQLAAYALERELDNPNARLADDPLGQLVGENSEHAVVEDGNEAEQEMDDIIVDVEEIERIGGKVLQKISKFWGEEGFRHVVLNLAVYLAGVFVSLGLYATCFRHRDVKAEQEFRYGTCECLGDSRVCVCGLCCPAIRWADTISDEKGGFLDFNSALLVMMGLGITCLCPYAGIVAWIGIVFVGVYYRQRIRLRYGLEADTVQSYIEDIFVWGCCAWCAICQEARQVDEETEEEQVTAPKQGARSMSTSW